MWCFVGKCDTQIVSDLGAGISDFHSRDAQLVKSVQINPEIQNRLKSEILLTPSIFNNEYSTCIAKMPS